MDLYSLRHELSSVGLADIQFFKSLGSTNDVAIQWVKEGAADLSLVVADEQKSGRGRAGRHWVSTKGSGLSFTLIFHSDNEEKDNIQRVAPLGALGVAQTLIDEFGLAPEIKWPNDVLLERKKVCGVLAEAHWMGSNLIASILGIGINVTPLAIPPPELLAYPATSVESVLGAHVDRVSLLKVVLENVLRWRQELHSTSFMNAWGVLLAYKNEWVNVISPHGKEETGKVVGLDESGGLILRLCSGELRTFQAGEISMRPIVDRQVK
jgi:BirA family biotin operon repressor/biotin-[acetyl-CoA-carboxylase] ligase